MKMKGQIVMNNTKQLQNNELKRVSAEEIASAIDMLNIYHTG